MLRVKFIGDIPFKVAKHLYNKASEKFAYTIIKWSNYFDLE